MKMVKAPKLKAANDNRHDPFMWEFLHKYLELWFKNNYVDRTPEQFNRCLHYTYELLNRPWVPEKVCTQNATQWLRDEATSLRRICFWL